MGILERPAPTVDALLALLKQDTTGIGVTTAELARHMNKSTVSVAAALGRMRAYGYVSKEPPNSNGRFPQELVRWRARERKEIKSMIESRKITAKAEWLEWRKADVTASAIGALLGYHPYLTSLKLHLSKRGVNFAQPDNKVTRRGRWLEPAVAKAVSEVRPPWELEQADVYLRDGDRRLGASPDFFIHNDPRGLGVLQAKTTVPAELEKDWDGGREIPGWIAWQTRTEMMLADAVFGAVAVLVDDPFDMDVHIIEIARDTHAEDAIAKAVREFWHDVERGIQPAADYGRDSDAIRALAGREQTGKTLDLSGDNQLRELLEQRAALKARAKAFEARCTEIENGIMHKLGDAERGVGLNGWHITFKSTDRASYTVAPKTGVRTLRITDRRPPEQRPDGGEDI